MDGMNKAFAATAQGATAQAQELLDLLPKEELQDLSRVLRELSALVHDTGMRRFAGKAPESLTPRPLQVSRDVLLPTEKIAQKAVNHLAALRLGLRMSVSGRTLSLSAPSCKTVGYASDLICEEYGGVCRTEGES